MQSLWSRAGQARFCGCRGCPQVAGGMVRQSTTRVPRRKPTFGEIFTAFYTSIMGTAAMLDAQQKDVRRKDLNRQINEVKADLDRLMTENTVEYYPDMEKEPPAGDIHNRYRTCWLRGVQHGPMADFLDTLGEASSWHKTPPRSAELDKWWRSASLPQLEQSIMKGKETDYDLLLRRLEQEESDPYIAHRLPRSSAQLIHSEMSTRALVSNLMRAVGITPPLRPAEAREQPDYVPGKEEESDNPSVARLLKLYSARPHPFAKYSYPYYNTRTTDANDRINSTCSLHNGFQEILSLQGDALRTLEPDDVRERVLKICHNLLVSPYPLTVYTLCRLLLGFDRLGHHDVANAVAVHFLYHSRLEPTQLTLACLFNHYKEKGDFGRLHGLIQRCTGRDPRGVGIRMKEAEDVHQDPYLSKWARLEKVVCTDGFYVERAWFSGRLVDTIVHGLLSLDRLRHAVAIFAQGRDMGLNFCARTLMLLLDQCLYALDTDASARVLDTFLKTGRGVNPQTSASQWSLICEKLRALYDLSMSNAVTGELFPLLEAHEDRADLIMQQRRQRAIRTLVVKRKVDNAEHHLGELRTACLEHLSSFEAIQDRHVDETTYAEEDDQDEMAQGAPNQGMLELKYYRRASVPTTLISHETVRFGQSSAAYGA